MKKLLLLTLLATNCFANTDTHIGYCNYRFGYCVDYPNDFIMGAENEVGEGGHGRIFRDRKGFSMTTYAYNNTENATIDEVFENKTLPNGGHATYTKRGSNWLVISGYIDDNIYYCKTWVGKGSIDSLSFLYPRTKKSFYDAEVNYMVKHFRPGNLDAIH